MTRSGKHSVFDLKDLSGRRVHQQRIGIVAHPFVTGRGYLEREQPVVADEVVGTPVRAGQNLTIHPAMWHPFAGPVVRADPEAAGSLEVVVIAGPIHGSWACIPAVRLGDALIPARALMRFPVSLRPRGGAVLVSRLTYRGCAEQTEDKRDAKSDLGSGC